MAELWGHLNKYVHVLVHVGMCQGAQIVVSFGFPLGQPQRHPQKSLLRYSVGPKIWVRTLRKAYSDIQSNLGGDSVVQWWDRRQNRRSRRPGTPCDAPGKWVRRTNQRQVLQTANSPTLVWAPLDLISIKKISPFTFTMKSSIILAS